ELHAPALAVRAHVVLAAHAPVAAVAGVEEWKRDAIAFLQRLAERIRRDALAQTVHHSCEFVAGHAAHVRTRIVAVVAPVVEIRPADRSGGVLGEDAPRLGAWGRQGAARERRFTAG